MEENTQDYGIPTEEQKVQAFHKLSEAARNRLKVLVVNGCDLNLAREKMANEGYIKSEKDLTDTMYYACRSMPDVKDRILERQQAVVGEGFADFGNRVALLNHSILDYAIRLYPDKYAPKDQHGDIVDGTPGPIYDIDLRIKASRAMAAKLKLMDDMVGEREVITKTTTPDGATTQSVTLQRRTEGVISQSEMVQRLRQIKQTALERKEAVIEVSE